MSEPVVIYDFEFGFLAGGAPLFITAHQGRDHIAADEARVKIELHPDEDTVEEVIVSRASLAYMRTTQRTVQPEPTVGEAQIPLGEVLA